MKKIAVLSVTIGLLLAGCTNSTSPAVTNQSMAVDTTKIKTGDAYYQCEMHPEVISDKEGTCIKCDMELTKVVKK